MIKVALVGIGGMGFVHYNAYKSIQGAEVVAVADPRVEMAREKVGNDGAKVYASMAELLANENPDMVDICTPTYMHAELSIEALRAGKHVLCEKPMSLNTTETQEVIKVANECGKLFMTAHVVRFMIPYLYLKKVIDSGELGKPVHIQMKRISSIPRWSWEDWMRDVKKSGGAPLDLSIHDIDFAQYVFGQPKSVSGVHHAMNNDTDYIVSDLVYDGFTVSIIGGWYKADIPFDASYLAVFENGSVKHMGGETYYNNERVELDLNNSAEDTGINITSTDGYAQEIAYFVDCVENGTAPTLVTPESSEDSVRLVERILDSVIEL